MSRIRKNSTRRFTFERLEAREQMAGDLAAQVVNGDLIITGGAVSSGLKITSGPTDGTVQIVGLAQAGLPTKINHQTGPLTFAVPHDVVVQLGNGDDRVVAENLHVIGNLKLDLGAGSDTLSVANSHVNRGLLIDTAAGNDTVTLSGDKVGGKIDASLGQNDDYFAMLGTHCLGNVNLDMGWQADRVTISDSQIDYAMSIVGQADSAAKQVSLSNVQVRLGLSIETGDGHDKLCLAHVSAADISLKTNGGTDRVDLDTLAADHLSAALGAGDDVLSFGNSTIGRADFGGGAGVNRLLQPKTNHIGSLSLSQFTV